MFNFVCKYLPYLRSAVRTSPTQALYFLQRHPSSSSSLKSIPNASNENSFTVTYQINSCGFSSEKALSATKYINLKSPENPDSVLAFLESHGFTKTEITSLIARWPEKTLLPKIEIFQSKSISHLDMTRILTRLPKIFNRSLANQIIPSFNFFNNLIKSEEKRWVAIKRFSLLLMYDAQIYVAPNIGILREVGVPESNIVLLLTYQPRALTAHPDNFKEIVDEVKKMGFNPMRMKFVLAIRALRAISKSTWKKKVDVFEKWGLSKDEVLVAFGKLASEDKIARVIDFFVNRMCWKSSIVAKMASASFPVLG